MKGQLNMKRLLLAMLIVAAPAMAQTKSQPIDMTVVLHDDNGRALKDPMDATPDDPKCAHCRDLTLGRAAAHALFGSYPDERSLSGDDKWARGLLAGRIRDAKKAELSAEEVTLLKKLIAEMYGPVVIVQAFPALDPNALPPKVH